MSNTKNLSIPNDHYLTVGTLRKSLEGLPNDMPVLYQRIEDTYFRNHGWKSHGLTWERHTRYNHETREIEDHDDICQYIVAWDAYQVTTPDESEVAFVINAHY